MSMTFTIRIVDTHHLNWQQQQYQPYSRNYNYHLQQGISANNRNNKINRRKHTTTKNINYLSKVSSTLGSSVQYRGTIAENLLQESNVNVLRIQAMGTSVMLIVGMSKIIRNTVDLMAETSSFKKVCGQCLVVEQNAVIQSCDSKS